MSEYVYRKAKKYVLKAFYLLLDIVLEVTEEKYK